MIKGSCCCKAVLFELLAEPTVMGTCHCSRCRKVGASNIVFVRSEDLKWVQGKEHVALYQPATPYKYGRCFCKVCGTSLGEILSEEARFPIAVNALDTEFDIKNQFHEFVSDKPSWYEICDPVKQSEGGPAPS